MTIWGKLLEPFHPSALGWKPQTVSGHRCLAIAYIDARDVMKRLDDVVGPENWSSMLDELPDGCIRCILSIRIVSGEGEHRTAEWVSKTDVGGPSDQKDLGDRKKAAASDALKRAAVQWGIGRYIYALDGMWVDYDAQKKQIVKAPVLPTWALPANYKPETAKQTERLQFIADSPTMMKAMQEKCQSVGVSSKDILKHFDGAYEAFRDIPVGDYKHVMDWLDTFPEKVAEAKEEPKQTSGRANK